MVTNEINKKVTQAQEPVKSVRVTWPGDVLHAKVGQHRVQAQITLEGREERLCYDFTFIIENVDQCRMPSGSKWSHNCHSSTDCEDSIGSFTCRCPGTSTAEDDPVWQCAGMRSTDECCTEERLEGRNETKCKGDFTCYVDECPGACATDAGATCFPTFDASRYTCTCPTGLVGSARKCDMGTKPPTLFLDETHDIYSNATGFPVPSGGVDSVCGCQRVSEVNSPCLERVAAGAAAT